MSYLEKLFVFTLALSFLVIAFMLALYFDVGDMIYGKFAKGSSFRAALAESAVALLERQSRTRAVDAAINYLFRNEDVGVPQTQADFVGSFSPPTVARDTYNDLRRVELRRMGVTNNDYIEMEALGKDRQLYEQTIEAVDGFLERDEFDRAVQEIQNALQQTDPKNLYVQRDLWAHLMNSFSAAGRTDDAKDATRKYADLQERILKLRQAAGATVSESEWQRLNELKSSIDSWFAAVARGEAKLGSTVTPVGPTVEEKMRARQQLDEALRRGEVNREEYDRVARELGI